MAFSFRAAQGHDLAPAPFSPAWAFVVQLRAGTSLTPTELHGRVEHVVSGQAATFASWDEARAFMAQVLKEVEESQPKAQRL